MGKIQFILKNHDELDWKLPIINHLRSRLRNLFPTLFDYLRLDFSFRKAFVLPWILKESSVAQLWYEYNFAMLRNYDGAVFDYLRVVASKCQERRLDFSGEFCWVRIKTNLYIKRTFLANIWLYIPGIYFLEIFTCLFFHI